MKLSDFKATYLALSNEPAMKDANEKSVDECVPAANKKAKGKYQLELAQTKHTCVTFTVSMHPCTVALYVNCMSIR